MNVIFHNVKIDKHTTSKIDYWSRYSLEFAGIETDLRFEFLSEFREESVKKLWRDTATKLASRSLTWFLDLKTSRLNCGPPKIADIELVTTLVQAAQFVFTSFDHEFIKEIGDSVPSTNRAIIVESRLPNLSEYIARIGCNSVQLNPELFEIDEIRSLTEKGVSVIFAKSNSIRHFLIAEQCNCRVTLTEERSVLEKAWAG
jgi:hypothetical protein